LITDPREQLPLAGNALERMNTTVREHDSGAVYEILDGSRRQDLPAAGERCDSRADMNGDTPDVLTSEFALAGVQTAANRDANSGIRSASVVAARTARVGPSKVARRPVAGVLDDAPLEPCDRQRGGITRSCGPRPTTR
jgi:hypothetical protein